MNYKEGIDYAMHRGRVRNTASGKVGNLVEWCKGSGCKVFIGYEWIGAIQMPIFERWMKDSTEKEQNSVPVSSDGHNASGHNWRNPEDASDL